MARTGVFASDTYTKWVIEVKGVQTSGDVKISLRLFDCIPPSVGNHGMS